MTTVRVLFDHPTCLKSVLATYVRRWQPSFRNRGMTVDGLMPLLRSESDDHSICCGGLSNALWYGANCEDTIGPNRFEIWYSLYLPTYNISQVSSNPAGGGISLTGIISYLSPCLLPFGQVMFDRLTRGGRQMVPLQRPARHLAHHSSIVGLARRVAHGPCRGKYVRPGRCCLENPVSDISGREADTDDMDLGTERYSSSKWAWGSRNLPRPVELSCGGW